MTIDMSQFYQAFYEEAEELLAQAEQLLISIDVEKPDTEELNAIFRAAHSIKGGAATFGFKDMAEITHILENLLDRIRHNEITIAQKHIDTFLAAKDVIQSQLNGHRSGEAVDREVEAQMKLRLQELTDQGNDADADTKSVPIKNEDPPPPPEKTEEKAAPSEANATIGGLKTYRIELPTLKEKDIGNLQSELELLGKITNITAGNSKPVFSIETEDSKDSIISICSFIVEPEDIVITEAQAEPAKEQIAQVAKPKAVIEEDDGFGLFVEIEPAPTTPPTQPAAPIAKVQVEDKPKTADTKPAAAPSPTPAPAPTPAIEAVKEEPKAPAAASTPAAAPTPKSAAPKEDASKKAAAKSTAGAEAASIRVGVEKVDKLINLIGELVITQAMIEQKLAKMTAAENEYLAQSIGQLSRNTRDLQEAVMSIRMMPMEAVFSRFPRMVRDLAGKLNKKIELVTNGATTELDKGLIERIVDPLTHLIRNSIDHGIELPEKRKSMGKNETGRLSLSASNRGGNIVIEVSDDGGGLNRERILSKARENGLKVSEDMADEDVWQLIFAAGFSTAEAITDVSGRGVGMDIVKRNVAELGGVINIKSAPGYGTTMSISMPLTLAIMDGMSISLGKNIFIIPLGLIIETMKPQAQDIKTVAGEGLMIHVRGDYLPIIPLHSLFNHETKIKDPTEGVLIILEAEDKKAALFVDGLVGQQQVVVKSIEANFKKIRGVSGATIMGDGSVALIIDVPAILKMGQHNQLEGAIQ